MPPKLHYIHETCLYGDDLSAMERFYSDVLGLRKVSEMSPRGMTFRVNDQNLLLVFRPDETVKPHEQVPSHGCRGAGHVAFAIEPDDLEKWRTHLVANGIPIETETAWETGAKSVYFRDPAGNSIEFVAGELWPA